jgi:hypothetical protein
VREIVREVEPGSCLIRASMWHRPLLSKLGFGSEIKKTPGTVESIGFAKNKRLSGGPALNAFSSVFGQILKLFPRSEFAQLVKETGAERHARGFTSWQQFVAMVFCQLGEAQSLREICQGLASIDGKINWESVVLRRNRLSPMRMSIDLRSSIRRFSGRFTIGKYDVVVAREMLFEPGTILVFDRGYNDLNWFVNLHQRGVFFVTRIKQGTLYSPLRNANRRKTPGSSATPSSSSRAVDFAPNPLCCGSSNSSTRRDERFVS